MKMKTEQTGSAGLLLFRVEEAVKK